MKNGRNKPCPCGSGTKHKRCCYHDDRARLGAGPAPLALDDFARWERMWDAFCDADEERRAALGLKIFEYGLACDGARKGPARTSRALEQGCQAVQSLLDRGQPRQAEVLLEGMQRRDPRLLAGQQRWVAFVRAECALLSGRSPAPWIGQLVHPDTEGAEDLIQLTTAALYLDLHLGLDRVLEQGVEAAQAVAGTHPALVAELMSLLCHVRWAELLRAALRPDSRGPDVFTDRIRAAEDHPRPAAPEDHLLGRAHRSWGDGAFACRRPRAARTADLERLTLELSRRLYCHHGWTPGRALLAAHMLRRCLAPNGGAEHHVTVFSDQWPDKPEVPGAAARWLVPSQRAVLQQFEGIDDPAPQFRAAALSLALPCWLDGLGQGLLDAAAVEQAHSSMAELLRGGDAWTMIWENFHHPTVLADLNGSWLKFRGWEAEAGNSC